MIAETETFEKFRSTIIGQCHTLRSKVDALVAGMANKERQVGFRPEIVHTRLDEIEAFVQLMNDFVMLSDWYITALQSYGPTVDRYGESLNNNLQLELDILNEMLDAFALDIQDGDVIIHRVVNAIRSALEHDQWKMTTRLIVTRSTRFSVRRHFYSEGIRTLNVPINLPVQPWRWSMIVHELANLIVTPNPRIIRDAIGDAAAIQRAARIEDLKKDLRETPNLFPRSYIAAVLDERPERIPRSHIILDSWIEELLEDAVTMLVMGETGFLSLQDMLDKQRHSTQIRGDDRHPSPLLRLRVALLVLQMTNTTPPKSLALAEQRFEECLKSLSQYQQQFVPIIDQIAVAFAHALKRLMADDIHLVKPSQLWSCRDDVAGSDDLLRSLATAYETLNEQTPDETTVWLAQTVEAHADTRSKQGGRTAVADRIEHIRQQLAAPVLPRSDNVLERYNSQIMAVVKANYHDLVDEHVRKTEGNIATLNRLIEPSDATVELLFDAHGSDKLLGSFSQDQLYVFVFGTDDPGKCCSGCSRCCCRRTCSAATCPAKCIGNQC